MPDYSIKAPNGKTYRISGPAGATQAQIQAEVLRQFPDAGKAAPAQQGSVKNAFGLGAPPPKGSAARATYDAEYNRRFNAAWLADQRRASKPATRKQQVDAAAKQASDTAAGDIGAFLEYGTRLGRQVGDTVMGFFGGKPSPLTQTDAANIHGAAQTGGNFLAALKSGVIRGVGDVTLGAPERIASGVSGVPLDLVRAKTDADMAKSTPGAIAGNLLGGLPAGAFVGGRLAAGTGALAAKGIPVVSKAANVLQNLMTLKKGQRLANVGKIAAQGAFAGGAAAAGNDKDILTGAAAGAVAAPAFAGGLKVAQVISRPVRDLLRMTTAKQILSRFTSATADEIAAKAQAYRDSTGAEPTLFELLPSVDRNKLLKQGVVGRDNVVDKASAMIRDRAGNLGPEMSARANQIVGPQRDFVRRGIQADLATARGGAPAAGDAALADRAMRSPLDFRGLRRDEARAYMAAHDDTNVAPSLEDLYPSVPAPDGQGGVTMLDADPEVTAVLRSAAGTLRRRNPNAGITVRDVTDMMSALRKDVGKGGIEGRTAQRAVTHLQDMLDSLAPDAGAAARRMSDAYAARSRMRDGMLEGMKTRLRDAVPVESDAAAQKLLNAYDSPEGAAGRTLGQANKILTDLGGSPDEALKATVDMSRGGIGRQLAQNLGPRAADDLVRAAQAQDSSAQALAAAAGKATQSGGTGNLNPENLVQALINLHPASFVTTKASAIRHIMDMSYVPEAQAMKIVDLAFSQDPAKVRMAINALGNLPNGVAAVQALSNLTARAAGDQRGSGDASTVVPPAAAQDGGIDGVDSLDTAALDGAAGIQADVIGGHLPGPDEPGYQDFIDAGYQTDAQGNLIDPGPDGIDGAAAAGGDYAPAAGYALDQSAPYAHQVVQSIFPDAVITSDVRSADDSLSKANPHSYHATTQNAVDVRPIPGMTFSDFIERIKSAGYSIIEAKDEVKHPSRYATGPHWHVVIAG